MPMPWGDWFPGLPRQLAALGASVAGLFAAQPAEGTPHRFSAVFGDPKGRGMLALQPGRLEIPRFVDRGSRPWACPSRPPGRAPSCAPRRSRAVPARLAWHRLTAHDGRGDKDTKAALISISRSMVRWANLAVPRDPGCSTGCWRATVRCAVAGRGPGRGSLSLSLRCSGFRTCVVLGVVYAEPRGRLCAGLSFR
jgi:hypothetical protein